jgi:hypothetical protein
MKKETTSIKIDPKLWKKVKIHCITQETQISEFLEGLIKKKLKVS